MADAALPAAGESLSTIYVEPEGATRGARLSHFPVAFFATGPGFESLMAHFGGLGPVRPVHFAALR
jgi:hypothetical protein